MSELAEIVIEEVHKIALVCKRPNLLESVLNSLRNLPVIKQVQVIESAKLSSVGTRAVKEEQLSTEANGKGSVIEH